MLGRYSTGAVIPQACWAKPLGDFNHRWLGALFTRSAPRDPAQCCLLQW